MVSVSIVAATVYILTGSAQGSPFRHILFNFCYLLPFLMLVILTDMRCFGVLCIILDINPLSDIQFVNIFSHFVGCLFILLMVFFAAKAYKSD